MNKSDYSFMNDSKDKDMYRDVERIIAYRYNRFLDCSVYLVRWKYYGPDHDTWEKVINIKEAHKHLIDFLRRTGQLENYSDYSDDSDDE